MRKIMEADYPQPYHKNALTAFILGRWLGFGIAGAYFLQALVTLLAIIASVRIWRPEFMMDNRLRALLTGVLAILATPYAYSYDAIPYCLAVACFFLADRRLPRWPIAVAYLWPLFLHVLNGQGIGIGILPPAVFAGAMVRLAIVDDRSTRKRTNLALSKAS